MCPWLLWASESMNLYSESNIHPPSFHLTSIDDELVCMTMPCALSEEYSDLQLADKCRVESGSSPVVFALSASIESCYHFRDAKASASKEAQESQKPQEGGRKHSQKAEVVQEQPQASTST